LVEAKCWIDGLFIDQELLNGTQGRDIVRWGVGPARRDRSNYIYQRYYQWIVPILVLQALIFYLPRIVWHIWENGLMNKLLGETG
jgi:innexin